MRTKNIIIILAAMALCCFASSCAKQKDFDGFKEETDTHLGTVEGQAAYLKELTATLGEEHTVLKVYVAALGAGSERYAFQVDSLLTVLDGRLDAAEATIPNLVKMSYAKSTFATLKVVDSLTDVAVAIAAKVRSDSTALDAEITKRIAASEETLMKMFSAYYKSAVIDDKIDSLSCRLDTLFRGIDSVKSSIDTLKADVEELKAVSNVLAQKLDDDVAALKAQDTVFLKQIDSLDKAYADTLGSLAKIVSADSARIAALEERVTKLEGRVQSVRVVPNYSDGKVNMKKGDTEIKFDVRPVSAAKAMATKTSAFSFQIIEALATTKASIYTDITVKSAKMSGADSLLVLTIDGTTMPADFFTETKLYNARLRIYDAATSTDCASSYFPLTPPPPIYPEALDSVCIKIGGIWWAPVNCGYDATNYPYGKLYQWGRKHGCGYYDGSAYFETIIQDDATGPVSATNEDSTKFYNNNPNPYDWLTLPDSTRWNSNLEWPAKEASPVKTAFDPCPTGWRVPTFTELWALIGNNKLSPAGWDSTKKGYWLNGTTSPSVGAGLFLPAAGKRSYNGVKERDSDGYYWSSAVYTGMACSLLICSTFANMSAGGFRQAGHSVRCVKE